MKIGQQTLLTAASAPARANEAPKDAAVESTPSESFEPSEKKTDKGKLAVKIVLNTLYSAGAGALAGHYIHGSDARSTTYGAIAGGVIGSGVGALAGGGYGWLKDSENTKMWSLGGAAVGGAAGAAIFGLVGHIDHVINSALPWSPAVNGAVIGGSLALAGGIYQMATAK